MRHGKLTDDELALIHKFDTDVRTGIFFLRSARSRSYLEAVNKNEREYQEYTAELRRRYFSPRKNRFTAIRHAWSWVSSLAAKPHRGLGLLGWSRERKAQAVA